MQSRQMAGQRGRDVEERLQHRHDSNQGFVIPTNHNQPTIRLTSHPSNHPDNQPTIRLSTHLPHDPNNSTVCLVNRPSVYSHQPTVCMASNHPTAHGDDRMVTFGPTQPHSVLAHQPSNQPSNQPTIQTAHQQVIQPVHQPTIQRAHQPASPLTRLSTISPPHHNLTHEASDTNRTNPAYQPNPIGLHATHDQETRQLQATSRDLLPWPFRVEHGTSASVAPLPVNSLDLDFFGQQPSHQPMSLGEDSSSSSQSGSTVSAGGARDCGSSNGAQATLKRRNLSGSLPFPPKKRLYKPEKKFKIPRSTNPQKNNYVTSSNYRFHYKQSPVQMVKASRQYMFDADNNEYLDCISSQVPAGHCHSQVVMAAQNQMGTLAASYGFLHQLLPAFIKKIVETLPSQLCVAYVVNSGSEANDFALRLAQSYTRGSEIFCMEGSYHGNTSATIDVSAKHFGRIHKNHMSML